ncbi:endo alpha-1,4 polygalactosaminidase [Metabacillus fastidiosus]|uniref:endo alpha-1,4 polygalactosaminidase n=1 Tax=Metabacillus fastidiosus TaxID=1458 RepID=UPI002DB912A6|nr:endo alpha-1,4 polygalactosaminidase [Metabacillus fastidiosus]MEC2076206.1 endo alpha-1,4 polygalactosaminidase [Metabacillus fastidiosus]
MFKKTFFSINLSFLLLLTYCFPANGQTDNPLMGVNSYSIFYDHVDDAKVKQLSKYDMVVIEPHEITKERVAALKEKGTLTLGYISIMELQTWDEEFVAKVQDSDYLRVNGEKVYVEDWDTYLMDITNKHYQQLLLDEIQDEIAGKGFDGIILDTVGDIDDFFYKKDEIANPLRQGYVEILQQIKNQHSNLLLLQNWGFKTLEASSKNYIDGIMWENFDKGRLETNEWGQNWISYFKNLKQQEQIAVFTVAPDSKSVNYSRKQGFVPYKHANSIYN